MGSLEADCYYFSQIASVLEEAWAPDYTYIAVLIDTDAIQKLQLELTLDDIKWAIVAAKKLKIKQEVPSLFPGFYRDI